MGIRSLMEPCAMAGPQASFSVAYVFFSAFGCFSSALDEVPIEPAPNSVSPGHSEGTLRRDSRGESDTAGNGSEEPVLAEI